MITDILSIPLILPNMSHCGTFRFVINLVPDVENILNDDELFADTVVTSKESVEHERRRECLNCTISKGKMYLLGNKNNERLKGNHQ